jgi:hypothetical protein
VAALPLALYPNAGGLNDVNNNAPKGTWLQQQPRLPEQHSAAPSQQMRF